MKVAVLAAGEGKRLYPITETRAKQLIYISGKPLIIHTLTTLKESGFNDIIILTDSKNKKLFDEALAEHVIPDITTKYIIQKLPKGTAHATSLVIHHLNKEPILLIYGDVIPNTNLIKRLISIYKKFDSNLIVAAKVPKASEFGVVKVKNNVLTHIVEKPICSTSNEYINAGIYVIKSDIFPFIDNVKPSIRDELELTDSINNYISSGGTVKVVKAEEREWNHVSFPWDILEVNKNLLNNIIRRNEGSKEKNVVVNGEVIIRKGAILRSGSVIEGPAYIGEESVIGPNCFIRQYTTIGPRVKIGNACEIKNSIIMSGSKISHLSYIGDSIIAENCNIGAGTITANLRLDEKSIKTRVKGVYVDSGIKKFGAILGDQVKTGIHVCLMPGIKVGCNSIIGPNSIIYEDIPSFKFVKTKYNVKITDLK